MPAGDVKETLNVFRSTCLLAGVSATNSAPALATDGVPCNVENPFLANFADAGVNYYRRPAIESVIFVKVTGTGTVSATVRMWGYHAASAEWYPLGAGADSTKGTINAAASMGEVKTDKVLHCEPLYLGGCFDRLYAEVVAISGTTPAVECWIATPRLNTYQ